MKNAHRLIAVMLLLSPSLSRAEEKPKNAVEAVVIEEPVDESIIASEVVVESDVVTEELVEEVGVAEPETLEVQAEPLKVEIEVDGVFEATKATEIILRPEAWAELSVLSAVEHGRRVKKGTPLIKFDPQNLDTAIEDLQRTVAANQLAVRQAEAALKLSSKSTPQSLATAKRAAAEAAENLQQFEKIDRAESIKDNEFNVESAKNSLSYQLEELRQLEKMYNADDLTEETEEIIITRARNRLKVSQYMLDRTLLRSDRFLKIELPRQEVRVKQEAEAAALALEQAQSTLPDLLTNKTLALEKLKAADQEARQKLARLKRDRKLMTINAPAEGVVYYGQATRGKWPEISATAKVLRQGGMAKANQVLITIVGGGNLVVRSTIDEKDLHDVSKGAKATLIPTAYPDGNIDAVLANVSAVPISDGKFDATIRLGNSKSVRLVAGMTCKAKITVYENANAILVPKSTVASASGNSHHIYVLTNAGKKKRRVKVGREHDGKLEIKAGLKPGDEVLLKNPDSEDPVESKVNSGEAEKK